MEYLVPSNHQFVMLGQDLLQALVVVGLEVLVILHAVRVDECLNLRIGVPELAVHLVSADVKVGVGEKFAHLFDELVEEFISLFASGIGDGARSSDFEVVRAGTAGQFGISHEP